MLKKNKGGKSEKKKKFILKLAFKTGKINTPSQEESLFGTTWSVNVNIGEHGEQDFFSRPLVF